MLTIALHLALACILPTLGSNCDSALLVARSIDCQTLGPACYATVAAMYNNPDPALVEAADCGGGGACEKAQDQCHEDPSGPAMCMLMEDDSVASCVNDAQAAGVVDLPVAELTCGRMFDLYSP